MLSKALTGNPPAPHLLLIAAILGLSPLAALAASSTSAVLLRPLQPTAAGVAVAACGHHTQQGTRQ